MVAGEACGDGRIARPLRRLTLFAVGLGVLTPCVAAETRTAMPADRVLIIESDWRLERFGTDIFILRAAIAPVRTNGSAGSLILSCEGSARQIRLELPEPLRMSSSPSATGRALVRGFAAGDGRSAAFRAVWTRGKVIAMVGEPGSRAVVMRKMLDLLALRPASLDLLLSEQAGFGRLALSAERPLHLVLRSNGPGPETTAAFAAGCGLGRP